MKRIWISLVAAGLLMIAAFAPAAADGHEVTVDLDEIDGSGVSGTATLTGEDGQTTVTIEVEGTEEGAVHPVHIHAGTCADLGDVIFPLEDVVDGMSETVVEADLADIRALDHAINLHLSEDDMATWVACGNIGVAEVEEDDAVEEDDEVVEEDDEVVEEDDADDAVTDDEADDAEEVLPATGDLSGMGTETAVVLMALLASISMGAGLLIRRRTAHA